MEDMDAIVQLESPHHIDYDDMQEHVIQGDHELLYLDTVLRESLMEGDSNL